MAGCFFACCNEENMENTEGWTAMTQYFAASIRASLFSMSGDTSGDSEWLPSQRPALSGSQFNKTAPFMPVGFSSGNGFPQ